MQKEYFFCIHLSVKQKRRARGVGGGDGGGGIVDDKHKKGLSENGFSRRDLHK